MTERELLDLIAQARDEEWEELDLGSLWLDSIPESIGELTNLRTLILANNQIKIIPESLGQLINLRKLALSYNQIEIIPESLGQLTNLQVFNCDDNPLSRK